MVNAMKVLSFFLSMWLAPLLVNDKTHSEFIERSTLLCKLGVGNFLPATSQLLNTVQIAPTRHPNNKAHNGR